MALTALAALVTSVTPFVAAFLRATRKEPAEVPLPGSVQVTLCVVPLATAPVGAVTVGAIRV